VICDPFKSLRSSFSLDSSGQLIMASFIPRVLKFQFVDARNVGILGLGTVAFGIGEFGVRNTSFGESLCLPKFGLVSLLLSCSDSFGSRSILENEQNSEMPEMDAKRYLDGSGKELTAGGIRSKKWREANPEKYRAYWDRRGKELVKIWYEKNKEKIKEKTKEYREKNKDRISVQIKEWRVKNKESISIWQKEYNKKNKGKISLRNKRYREENRGHRNSVNKKYRESVKEKILIRWGEYLKGNSRFEGLNTNRLKEEFESWKWNDPELKEERLRRSEYGRRWRERKRLEKTTEM